MLFGCCLGARARAQVSPTTSSFTNLTENNIATMPGTPPDLPDEVVDIIIDCLDGHLVSLRACSLVCRSWSRLRRYVHHDLYVDLRSQHEWSRKVTHYRDSDLHFAVRRLWVDLDVWNDVGAHLHLAALVEHFPSVRHIIVSTYSNIDSATTCIRPLQFPPDVYLSLIGGPFRNFCHFSHLLRAIPGLTRLRMFRVFQVVDNGVDAESWPPSREVLPDLRHLNIEFCKDIVLDWLRVGNSTAKLQSMCLKGICTEEKNLFLASLGSSLHHLVLEGIPYQGKCNLCLQNPRNQH